MSDETRSQREAWGAVASAFDAWPGLNATEERFRELFEHAHDLILIVDPAGRILFGNQAWRQTLGYTIDEVAHLSVFDVTHRHHHAACQAWLRGTPVTDERGEVHLTFLTRDGGEVPVEGTTSTRSEGGQVVLLRGIFRNVSEEREALAAFRRSAELFQLLTTHLPVGVFQADAQGRLTYVSDRWREIAQMPHVRRPRGVWWQMVHPSDREAVLPQWESGVRHGHDVTVEFRVNTGTSAERWVRTRIAFAAAGDGGVRTAMGVTEDVTEARRAAEALRNANDELERRVRARTAQLEAANKELAQYAHVVSHDLKAPLRGVSRLAEWLARDHGDRLGKEGVEMFMLLQLRVLKMHQMIDGILAYSRIGQVREAERTVDLNDVLSQVIELLAPPPSVVLRIPATLPEVHGIREQLRQVFQNLLDNAIKFMDKPRGRVWVAAHRRADAWEFEVGDEGPGIDPRYHERIFQMFQRLEPGDDGMGSGIGLALVKRIVEARGGRLTLESSPGKGAVFRFTWPDVSLVASAT